MRFNKVLFLPVLSLASLMGGNIAEAAIPAVERDALLALYSATGGDRWHNRSGWTGIAGTECVWYGVSCDTEQSTITGLDLKANNLKGPLPDSLTQLTHLASSDFRFNGVYSDKQALIAFLDATGPVGSLHDTQTLDAEGIVFSNVTATGFDVSWNAVAYMQAGGYRVYMAEQIDTESGSNMTDFVQLADIADKSLTSLTLNELVSCRQYFIKVVSYTNSHHSNIHEVQSDGAYGPIIGTIPGYAEECTIIGKSNDDSFYLDPESPVEPPVVIDINDTGERSYYLRGANVWHLDGAAGTDKLAILGSADNTWLIDTVNGSTVNGNGFSNIEQLVGGSGMDSMTIMSYVGDFLTIDAGDGENILTGTDASNDWVITDSNTGTLNNNINFSSFQNLNGGSEVDIFTFYDGGQITGTLNFDLNDQVLHFIIAPVDISPFFSSGPGEHDIPENTEIGNQIVVFTRNNAVDMSLIASHFSITKGNEAGMFTIDSDTGAISLARPLDYETTTRYELEISFDLGVVGAVDMVIINVTDVTENDAAGGCTLRAGAPFDPIWFCMLLLAGFYRLDPSHQRQSWY